MFKAALLVALIVAVMVTIKDGRALRETGLISRCTEVAAPVGQDGYWAACRPGKLEGRPDLKRQSCESLGVLADVEYWRCPAALDSAPAG